MLAATFCTTASIFVEPVEVAGDAIVIMYVSERRDILGVESGDGRGCSRGGEGQWDGLMLWGRSVEELRINYFLEVLEFFEARVFSGAGLR